MDNVIENIDMRITDKWGVEWDEMETTRDFLQNFYDANTVGDINIVCSATDVLISAPAVFDYKELLYMGSDKGQDSNAIGQYGEGFKASLLNAMRNWNCQVELCVLDKKLRFYFKLDNIGRSEKKVIYCEISAIKPISGTELKISNCPRKLIEEFKFGMKYFYYDQNPLFGNNLLDNFYGDISIRESTEKSGYLFYKRLLRAKLDLPIIIICNKESKMIDNQIKHDRDRKAFNEKVTESVIKYACKQFSLKEFRPLVLYLKDWWEKGDKYLAVIAETLSPRWGERHKTDFFPDNYYARESSTIWPPDGIDRLELELKTRVIAEKFKNQKYICCPRYMSYFGMKTPDGEAIEELRISGENQEKNHRSPTLLEHEAIVLLASFCKEISLTLSERYENALYTIGNSDKIIGQYKSGNYKEKQIFLNTKFFTYQFSDAVAILLHEWTHIYGYDGSRIFSDALTEIIAIILKSKTLLTKLADFEERWNVYVKRIRDEREEKEREINAYNVLESLSQEQLKCLLMDIPENELKTLLKRRTFDIPA